MDDCEMMVNAERVATIAHNGLYQIPDEFDVKEPRIAHCARVAGQFDCPILKSVAWLHDVLRDTDYTGESLFQTGFPALVVDCVEVLTQSEMESYLEYILRIAEDPHAIEVKIEDLKDHLEHMITSGTNRFLKDKYDLALYLLERGI